MWKWKIHDSTRFSQNTCLNKFRLSRPINDIFVIVPSNNISDGIELRMFPTFNLFCKNSRMKFELRPRQKFLYHGNLSCCSSNKEQERKKSNVKRLLKVLPCWFLFFFAMFMLEIQEESLMTSTSFDENCLYTLLFLMKMKINFNKLSLALCESFVSG